jgi:hypothetical protein
MYDSGDLNYEISPLLIYARKSGMVIMSMAVRVSVVIKE